MGHGRAPPQWPTRRPSQIIDREKHVQMRSVNVPEPQEKELLVFWFADKPT